MRAEPVAIFAGDGGIHIEADFVQDHSEASAQTMLIMMPKLSSTRYRVPMKKYLSTVIGQPWP